MGPWGGATRVVGAPPRGGRRRRLPGARVWAPPAGAGGGDAAALGVGWGGRCRGARPPRRRRARLLLRALPRGRLHGAPEWRAPPDLYRHPRRPHPRRGAVQRVGGRDAPRRWD
ncbi:hypothetical protein BU14_0093s0025 [Porphyra umbilicalis]|uniref:Uncharacterized protein n=1 Tax=Porphyra umbilicalis TaxID=2786 RepID=A0A1X6PDN5_PORUM|nr:hypothetical protein BU14_0093s0025 [Porphyra umbilicalis]|eukprot:OSX78982.1 hypothetical protein BU14_0093s0025 [Porphyra umbilicalis]